MERVFLGHEVLNDIDFSGRFWTSMKGLILIREPDVVSPSSRFPDKFGCKRRCYCLVDIDTWTVVFPEDLGIGIWETVNKIGYNRMQSGVDYEKGT